MTRRVIGIVLSLALFVAGTWLLVRFVRSAEAQILAGERLAEVVVLTKPVQAGDSLDGVLKTEPIPARLIVDDAVLAQDSVKGQVALSDLSPGEQLLWSRIGEPSEIDEPPDTTRFEIPPGKSAVSIKLAPERAYGGLLLPGMQVAVVGSFTVKNSAAELSVETSHIMTHKALVIEVQAEDPIEADPVAEGIAAQSPEGNFLVTLAASTADIERIVFASEWGSIWLARQGNESVEEPTRIQSIRTIYERDPNREPDLSSLFELLSPKGQDGEAAPDQLDASNESLTSGQVSTDPAASGQRESSS